MTSQHPFHKPASLTRREILAGLAASCAGLLSQNTLAGMPESAPALQQGASKGEMLTPAGMKLLAALVDVIIPPTKTKGAAAVNTHGFIDHQLAHCQSSAEAAQFVAALTDAGELIERKWHKKYWALSPAEQVTVMAALAERRAPFNRQGYPLFAKLKTMTMIGYYSSEEGASKELVYLAVPGGYSADFSLADNGGKAYAIPFF
ncbi:gluconate 2-dehydrogenase subunit 3 family protein [Teredinibacter waterburyi]|jgi:hypothetical protein|uniref:gluconate 2-dehydrogenase subunit 3 family protein n=1 Tax=Teredinibacter waterburyi TaxID=1500538 RepID=UPI00165FF1DA|nr:gluconate 2-dehydrogenase subunit 3 family protein [Teredinibacter waterburyi]